VAVTVAIGIFKLLGLLYLALIAWGHFDPKALGRMLCRDGHDPRFLDGHERRYVCRRCGHKGIVRDE